MTLTCKFTGDNIISGYWERVGDRSLLNSEFNDDNITLQVVINEARPTHSGIYRCVVFNQWGLALSRNVQVTITSRSNNVLM